MNKQEFELMVRARDFINMSTPEKLAEVPDVIRYLKNSAPYNTDGQLMKLLGEIEREMVAAVKNQRLDELADFFVMEASRLASTDKHYVQYGVNFDSGAFGKRNVRINKDIDAIADEERFNVNIASRVAYLKAPGRDIARVTKIRGDGNCYFRAITTGFLQKAFCSEPATREASLKHFARLIREQLIHPNEISSVYYVKSEKDDPRPLDIKQHEQGEQLLRLAAKLDSMATGADPQVRSMQALHDLFEDIDFGDAVVKAARALLTHGVMNSLGELNNGLSLGMLIEAMEYESEDNYAQKILLQMGKCMEGPAIQFDLLARALGSKTYIWFFPSKEKESVSNVMGGHQAVDSGLNFWPNNPLNLMLRPGHYDLLETQANYEQRRQVEFAQGQAHQQVAVIAPSEISHQKMGTAAAVKQVAKSSHEKAVVPITHLISQLLNNIETNVKPRSSFFGIGGGANSHKVAMLRRLYDQINHMQAVNDARLQNPAFQLELLTLAKSIVSIHRHWAPFHFSAPASFHEFEAALNASPEIYGGKELIAQIPVKLYDAVAMQAKLNELEPTDNSILAL